MTRFRVFFVFIFCGVLGNLSLMSLPLHWPTGNPAWARGEDPENFLQPTRTGLVRSALFGCVRNNGNRFHEGVDLKATRWDARGEALDRVFAVLPGVVVHVNETAGHSSFGRYIVLEHPRVEPGIYTLYGHMRSVQEGIRPGAQVEAGETIGILGRSAGGYTIPKERAHLHFEMGVRLTDNFQWWFDARDFASPNRHGRFNGMNLVGFDPLAFYEDFREGRIRTVDEFLQKETVAFSVRTAHEGLPDFLERYPSLVKGQRIPDKVAGWEVDFTWYGLPVRWRPLLEAPEGYSLVVQEESLLRENACRQTVLWEGNNPYAGAALVRILSLLFGEEWKGK
ncbi:MAG: M23 family metallopeptidase [Opitutales bacterium]|nr:M23 family metallopeptidase [Opitutales bacterium]MCH8540273.1 M23 family metallopeptidase [Opitutales bacterium]